MTEQKLKIYKDIICLEMDSIEGTGWWYMGGNLAFTPIHIKDIKRVKYVVLEGTRKRMLVALLPFNGQERMSAINLVRSDTAALKAKGLWHKDVEEPYSQITYSPTPERRTYSPR